MQMDIKDGRNDKSKRKYIEPLKESTMQRLNLNLLAEFLESIEVQYFLLIFMFLDLCAISIRMYFYYEDHLQECMVKRLTSVHLEDTIEHISNGIGMYRLILRLIDTFMGFTIGVFLLELVVLVIKYRTKFFKHLGYFVDFIIILISLGTEAFGGSIAIRYLGICRVWRVFRFVSTLLETEKNEHSKTLETLYQEQTKIVKLQLENQAVKDSLRLEYEARHGLEKRLQGYKDEMETLQEALHIAAKSVAESTMGINTDPFTLDTATNEDFAQQNILLDNIRDSIQTPHKDTDVQEEKRGEILETDCEEDEEIEDFLDAIEQN